MRTIIVCTRDLDFGVGSVVKNDLNLLDKDKKIGKVIVIGPKRVEGYSKKINFELIENKGRFFITKEPNFAFKCNKKLKELISKHPIDKVYTHFPILAEDFGVDMISKFHTLHKSAIKNNLNGLKFLIGKIFHNIYSYFDRITIKHSKKVLFVSKRTLNQAKVMYPEYKYKMSYSQNSVNSSKFYKLGNKKVLEIKNRLGLNDGKINILYVGRLEPMKGIQNLVRVLRDFDKSKFRLLVIGDGPLKRKLISSSFVRFIGKVQNDELYKYYNSADIFILPSLYENAPMTILEAKACGCKILASNTGDNEYILDKKSIFNNEGELKDKLSLLIK